MDRILDIPVWLNELQPLSFTQLYDFELFQAKCQKIVRESLCAYNYDTFGSFVRFHEQYVAARAATPHMSFNEFFAQHRATLDRSAMSCVGLSLVLLERLEQQLTDEYDFIKLAAGPVSCEEVVKDVGSYTLHSPNTAKEHVLLAIAVRVAGRSGYILLDPGYHVGRAVVVMRDAQYPHTSWFVQSQQPACKKEYCYNLAAGKLVTWAVRETQSNGNVKEYSNLVYVRQAFGKPIDIAEKRSYVYGFKAFVIRGENGAVAGFYSYLKNSSISLFYPNDNGERIQHKYDLKDVFCKDMMSDLHCVAKQMHNDPRGFPYLQKLLEKFIDITRDTLLIKNMLKIDRFIEDEL